MPIINPGDRSLNLRLDLRIKDGWLEPIVYNLRRVVNNFDTSIRDDVLTTIELAIQDQARANIKEGEKESKYKQSGNLARSVKIVQGKGDTGHVIVDSIYAGIHNRPIGTYTVIVPKSAEALSFKWARCPNLFIPKKPKAGRAGYAVIKRVNRPGLAFFDRAVETVNRKVPSIIREVIAMYKDGDNVYATTISTEGGNVWALGSISKPEAVRRGLAALDDRGNIHLTASGEAMRLKAKLRKLRGR